MGGIRLNANHSVADNKIPAGETTIIHCLVKVVADDRADKLKTDATRPKPCCIIF